MTEREPRIRSDLTKADAHESSRDEYDEAPELTPEQLADAIVSPPVRGRGRPPTLNRKQPVKLRLDREIVEGFKATGPGWQTRINDILGRVLKRGGGQLARAKRSGKGGASVVGTGKKSRTKRTGSHKRGRE